MRYQGEKAVFAGKDTAKTVMHGTVLSLKCIQSRLQEVLLLNQRFNLCSMTKGCLYAVENNEKA